MKRRNFLARSAALAGAAATSGAFVSTLEAQQQPAEMLPEAIRSLKPMTPAPVAITDAERLARIEKARRLMRENGMSAMFLEPGTSMTYYTGVQWG